MAGDDQRAALVALRHQGEQHLGLVGRLLDVAKIVADHDVEGIKGTEGARQVEIAAGDEELLNELVGRGEQHADASSDERMSECACKVALADAWSPEQEHVGGALDEVATCELADLDEHVAGDAGGVECVEGLGGRQPRGATEPVDAALTTCLGFDLEHLGQGDECLVATCVYEAPGHLLGGAGQLELGKQRSDAVAELGGVRGHAAPAIVISSSYVPRFGGPMSTWGTSESVGCAIALTAA